MKKIITYGTFDLFHLGHLKILERAKKLGDFLVVAVSTDSFNFEKGKNCIYPYEHRAQIVEAVKYVDMVIPEMTWDQKIQDVLDYDIDLFVMGNDWQGKFDYLENYCDVVYLSRTNDISTTEIIDQVYEREVSREATQ
ncbi:glycerol-3-phosphate cytidylyltransferase [Desulfosediminicola flagellatus]|uniref:glycerol-3-phosphate cytidylyltransferase n=1 Tax=Desulfosediminicola flagellatus TaxID=2569541 RepID=UPI0010AC0DB0|nr:glycerol-3-phosphate cytidylyltransferase [Desulfosediminicola flagellatus]